MRNLLFLFCWLALGVAKPQASTPTLDSSCSTSCVEYEPVLFTGTGYTEILHGYSSYGACIDAAFCFKIYPDSAGVVTFSYGFDTGPHQICTVKAKRGKPNEILACISIAVE